MTEDPTAKEARELLGYPHPITGEICDFGRCNNCMRCLERRFHQERQIKRLGVYRGFEIGWMPNIPPRIASCFRGPNDLQWSDGLLAHSPDEAEVSAKECVDYRYRVEAWEFEHERKYDPFKDGCLPAN